jgi:DNA-binding NarL/FixJ family response regulator
MVGRDSQLRRVERALLEARAGRPTALVVAGAPGSGKSALLDESVARAPTFATLRPAGPALADLLGELADERAALPAPHAAALDAPPAGGIALPAAVLALLSAAVERRGPLLVAVDDPEPLLRDALRFAARRLAGPVVLLLVGEPGGHGLETVALDPLDDAAARTLLSPVRAPSVRERILRAADGNPLALAELPSQLNAAQQAGRAALPPVLAPGPRLRAAYARPADATLAVAAAMGRGPADWLIAAVRELGLDPVAVDAAERSGVLAAEDGALRFARPLDRLVAYDAATPEQRRAAHAALAAAAPDAPARAHHLAAAAADAPALDAAAAGAPARAHHLAAPPDAAILAAAARAARDAGGHLEAGAAFAAAAQRAADAAPLAEAAAQELLVAGDLDRAEALLDEVEPAAATRLRAALALRRGAPRAAQQLLVAAGEERLAAGDAAGAAACFLDAAAAPMATGDLRAQDDLVARARSAARRAGGTSEVLAELLHAELRIVRGDDDGGDAALERLVPRLGEVDLLDRGEIVGMAGQTSMWVGADERARRICTLLLDAYRAAGARGPIPYPLSVRAQLHFRRGDWDAARADADAAVRAARDGDQAVLLSFTLAILGRIRAATGEDAGELLREALRDAAPGHAIHGLAALGLAGLANGDLDAAIDALQDALDTEARNGFAQPAATMAAGDLVEALALAGRRKDAAARLAAVEAIPTSRWGQAVAARGRVLLADDDADLEELARLAAAAWDGRQRPFELARSELVAGERLLRARARVAARPWLTQALERFERLGAVPFAQRARGALAAAGQAVEVAAAPLTPQQRRIGALVAQGLTNREISQTIYVGEKTLERQLTALYRTLGISSRIELARLFSG